MELVINISNEDYKRLMYEMKKANKYKPEKYDRIESFIEDYIGRIEY